MKRTPLSFFVAIALLFAVVCSWGAVTLLKAPTPAKADQSGPTSLNYGDVHMYLANNQEAATNAKVQVKASAVNNLIYHGGRIMGGQVVAYAIYWRTASTDMSSTYDTYINRYLSDVGSSALYQNNTQYGDSQNNHPASAVFGGASVDSTPYPPGDVNQPDIESAVNRAIAANRWSTDLNHVFFVFTSQGKNLCIGGTCTSDGLCGYHGSIGTTTIYAAVSYGGGLCDTGSSPNGDKAADNAISTTSHEQMESATDPLVNKSSAWFDADGQEIGDKCQTSDANFTWNGHPYRVQAEWSNAASSCVAPQ